MFEWTIRYNHTKTEGTRISWTQGSAEVYADTEEEVRQIVEEEMPGAEILSLEKGELIED